MTGVCFLAEAGKGFFSLPPCPDWLWGINLTTHIHLAPRSSIEAALDDL